MQLVILFIVLALISEVAGTVGGFGSSAFFVPIAGFFFDFHTVLAITAVFHVFSNISKLILFRKTVNYRLVLLAGIPGILMVITGAVLSKYLQFQYSELILGIFVFIFSATLLIFNEIKLSRSNINVISGGGIAGFLAGIIGTGGAVRGLVLAAFDLEKNTFIATSATIDFGIDSSRTVVYLNSGYLKQEFYLYIPLLIGVAWVGSYIGKLLLNHINQETFKKIVLISLLLIGITSIFKGLFNY